jgi:nucleotide-binding universal stress UspA family protein
MTIRNVLVAVDFGEASPQTLRAGIDCARRFGAVLHAIHVVDGADMASYSSRQPRASPEQLAADAERSARHNLADALAASQAPPDARAIVLVSPRAADAILRYATTEQVDLIAIGRGRRNDVADIFLGSTAQELVSRASCPVLTLRTPNHQ